MKRSFKIKLLKRKQKYLTPRVRKNWCLYSPETRYLSTQKHNRLRSLYKQKLISLRKFKFLFGFFKTKSVQNFIGKLKRKKKRLLLRMCISMLFLKLDVFLFRLNFVKTIYEAKQLIRIGAVYVNGTKIQNSSYCLRKGDVLMIAPLFRKKILNTLSFKAQKILGTRWKRKKKFRLRWRRFAPCIQFRNFSQFEINYKLLTVVICKTTLSNTDTVLSFPYQILWQQLPSR